MSDNPRVNARNDTRELLAERTFLATVAATSGGLISIVRQGPDGSDGRDYPATSGLAATVSEGDLVLCVVTGGVVVVVAKIVTA